MKIFYVNLFLSAIITIFLSIRYSYETDYQPQGRYIYPIWMSLIIFTATGIQTILTFIERFIKIEKNKIIFETSIYTILNSIIIFIIVLANNMLINTTK